MYPGKTIFLALLCALTWPAMAQDTNALKTQIGRFESRTNVVIVKAYAPIGTIALGAVELSLRCKVTWDTATGEKVYGLAVEAEDQPTQRALIDDDEVNSLVNAIDYLAKINSDLTPLPGFEATYTSKAGLRLIARADRRDGGTHLYLQWSEGPRFPLSATQMTQLYQLVTQAQQRLDYLKAKSAR